MPLKMARCLDDAEQLHAGDLRPVDQPRRGLMSYGADFPPMYRRAADYVARISQGGEARLEGT